MRPILLWLWCVKSWYRIWAVFDTQNLWWWCSFTWISDNFIFMIITNYWLDCHQVIQCIDPCSIFRWSEYCINVWKIWSVLALLARKAAILVRIILSKSKVYYYATKHINHQLSFHFRSLVSLILSSCAIRHALRFPVVSSTVSMYWKGHQYLMTNHQVPT